MTHKTMGILTISCIYTWMLTDWLCQSNHYIVKLYSINWYTSEIERILYVTMHFLVSRTFKLVTNQDLSEKHTCILGRAIQFYKQEYTYHFTFCHPSQWLMLLWVWMLLWWMKETLLTCVLLCQEEGWRDQLCWTLWLIVQVRITCIFCIPFQLYAQIV